MACVAGYNGMPSNCSNDELPWGKKSHEGAGLGGAARLPGCFGRLILGPWQQGVRDILVFYIIFVILW